MLWAQLKNQIAPDAIAVSPQCQLTVERPVDSPFASVGPVFMAAGMVESPDNLRVGTQAVTWDIRFVVDRELLGRLERQRKRNHGDLKLGLVIKSLWLEIVSGELRSFGDWVHNEDRQGDAAVLPVLISHAQWAKLRQELGYAARGQRLAAWLRGARVRLVAGLVALTAVLGSFIVAVFREALATWIAHIFPR